MEDLIERLTKLQTITRKLRSSGIDEAVEGKLLDFGRFRIVAVGEDNRFPGGVVSAETEYLSCESTSATDDSRRIVQISPRLIEIDLFG